MQKILYFLIIMSFPQLYAQTDSLRNKMDNSIDLFLLNSFSIGYDFTLSEKSAINISGDISGDFFSEDRNNKSSYYGSSDTTFSKNNEEYSNLDNDYTLFVLYRNYFYMDDDLKCYFLLGPLVGYHYDKYKTTSNSSTNESKRSGLFSGFTFNPGLMYSITERLSLVAEYRFKFTYSWDTYRNLSKSSSKRIEDNAINRKRIQIQNLRVGFNFKI